MENYRDLPTTWIIHLSLVSPDNHKINTFQSRLAQGVNLEAALQELRTTLRNLYFEGKECRHSLSSGASIYLYQAIEMGEMNQGASCLFLAGTINLKTAGLDIPDYEGDLIPQFSVPEPNIPDGLKRESPCAVRDSSGKIIRFMPFLVLPASARIDEKIQSMHKQVTSTTNKISNRQTRRQSKAVAGNQANDNHCHDGFVLRHASTMKGGNHYGRRLEQQIA